MIAFLLLCILLVLIIGPEAFLNLLWGMIKFAFGLAIVLAVVAAVVALTL